MTKVYTFHPAAGVNKASNGAAAEKVDNGAPTLFSFWQQKFDSLNTLRCYFQAVTISNDINTSQNVTFNLIFRKLSAAIGTSVVIYLNGRFFDPSSNPTDRETGPLSDINVSTTQLVPAVAVAGAEFKVTFTVPGAAFIGQQGKEFLFEVVRDGASFADDYPDDIALVRVDVIQQENPPGFWADDGGGNIYYGGGNVGVGVVTATESFHTTGAIRLGSTANNTPGTIRWTGTDFEGRTLSTWVSLTAGAGGGNTLDQAYDQGGVGAGRTINVVKSGVDLPVLLQRDVSNPDYGLQLNDNLRIGLGGPTIRGFLAYLSGVVDFRSIGEVDLNIQSGSGGFPTSPVSVHTGDGDETGPLNLYTGNGSSGPSGAAYLYTGNSAFGTTGQLEFYTGNTTTSTSGYCRIRTGTTGASLSGYISLSTGISSLASSGPISLNTGNASTGSSGIISITTGDSLESGSITLETGTSNGAPGGTIALITGVTSGDSSGNIDLSTGQGTPSGNINLSTGQGTASGVIDLTSGIATSGNSGFVRVRSGPSTSASSGALSLLTGSGITNTGDINMVTGNSSDATGTIFVTTGNTTGGRSGEILITTGDGDESGHIFLTTGTSGARGQVEINADYLRVQTAEGLRLDEVTGTPSFGVNFGTLYTEDDGGDTELFYKDDSNNVVLLTEDGYATAGLGTDESSWTVNKDVTPGDPAQNTALNLWDGNGVNRISHTFQVESNATQISLQRWQGLSQTGVVLNFGAVGTTPSVAHQLKFNVQLGAGTITYNYDGTILGGRWNFDHPIQLGDDLKAYFGTSYHGFIYYDSSSGVFLMETQSIASGNSKTLGLRSGTIGSGSGTGNSGTIGLVTGATGIGLTGNIGLVTGDVNGSGNTGGIVINSGNSSGGLSGDITIGTGTASSVRSGHVQITTGNGTGGGNVDSGDITLITGAKANEADRGDIQLRSQNNLQTTEEDFWIIPGGETVGINLARYPLQVGSSIDSVITTGVNKVVIHRCSIASELVLQDMNGNYYALWVDTLGRLQIKVIGTIYTTHGGDTSGTVVGTQT